MFYEPDASTDGDTIVHFRPVRCDRRRRYLDMTNYPFIDIGNGGSVQGD